MSAIVIHRAPDGTVWNSAFEDLIKRNGLRDFDCLMQRADGVVIKHAIAQRKTVRLELPGGQSIYLKRHYPSGFLSALKQIVSPEPTAFDEFQAMAAFHESGIPTAMPVAAGKRSAGLLGSESFLVTLALEGCDKLDDYLQQYPAPAHKKEALFQLAKLIATMHGAGFNHRDLYLCHILRDMKGNLCIIDLHRVQQRSRVPEHRVIKDLAALNYSAPAAIITRADRLRFLKAYLGTARLSKQARRLAFKILKKSQKMLQHNKKNSTACKQ